MSGAQRSERLRVVNLRSGLAGPFDIAIAAGECLAITGPSGSGKSLFLRMIADLDPAQGEVFLDGIERRSIPAPAWRRRAVYNAAEPGWWSESVADHFGGAAMSFARTLAPRFGLAPALLNGQVVRLSTGERQRLALIRALALDSPVLLHDRLAAGVAIAMVTHSPEQAARLGHRHLRMAGRRLVPVT